MPIEIDIQTTDTASQALTAMASEKRVRGELMPRLSREWWKAGQVVVGNAVKHRFTGAGPFPRRQHRLGVVSGRLRRSIRTTRPQVNRSTGEMTMEMGSNVNYFGVHEFGFRGKVQVKGHTRVNVGRGKLRGGKFTKASQRQLVARRKAGARTSSQVRPHARKMNMPARAPLGTEIKSLRGRVQFHKASKRAIVQTYAALSKSKGGPA